MDPLSPTNPALMGAIQGPQQQNDPFGGNAALESASFGMPINEQNSYVETPQIPQQSFDPYNQSQQQPGPLAGTPPVLNGSMYNPQFMPNSIPNYGAPQDYALTKPSGVTQTG